MRFVLGVHGLLAVITGFACAASPAPPTSPESPPMQAPPRQAPPAEPSIASTTAPLPAPATPPSPRVAASLPPAPKVDPNDPRACDTPTDCILDCPTPPGCCSSACGCRTAINRKHQADYEASFAKTCTKVPHCQPEGCAYRPAMSATCRDGRCVAADSP